MRRAESDLTRLLLGALDGDAAAYRRFLAELTPRLKGFFANRLKGRHAEVDDLVQETLIAIHTKRATFDRAQPADAWIYAIARYRLIDHLRRVGRRSFVPVEDAGAALAIGDHGPAVEARADVARGLDALPERTRELVRRVKLEAEPVADVARDTGLSEGAVKVAVHRGFRRMVERLRGSGE